MTPPRIPRRRFDDKTSPMYALTRLDLKDLDGPLQFYVASYEEPHVVLTHRGDGPALRVHEITFRQGIEREMHLRGVPRAEKVILKVLLSLLPELCHGCGTALGVDDIAACRACQDRYVADLVRMTVARGCPR